MLLSGWKVADVRNTSSFAAADRLPRSSFFEVPAALRYGEFVADLAAETQWPRELDVMGIGWVLFAD